MLTYDVPKPKVSDDEDAEPSIYVSNFYVPANKEMIEALAVDEKVTLIIKGTVKSLESRENASESDRYEFTVVPDQIKLDPESNEFTEMADDEDDNEES